MNKLAWLLRFKFYFTLSDRVAVDEYWPMTDRDEISVIGLCWTYSGTNVVGFFWKGFCCLGLEYRWDNEPSLAIVVWNRAFGFWFPEDET